MDTHDARAQTRSAALSAEAILTPHRPHFRCDIDALASNVVRTSLFPVHDRPGPAFKILEQRCRDEACARSIDVTVAMSVLPMGKEALGQNKVKAVLGARHRHV